MSLLYFALCLGLALRETAALRRSGSLCITSLRPSSLKLAPVLQHRQVLTPLAMAEEDSSGLSFKSVVVGAVILLGVFGTGFISTLQSSIFARPNADQQLKKASSTEEGRGALTRLTRREIIAKLAQVPVFYVAQSGTQSVYLENGVGTIFLDSQAAQTYSKGKGQVKATSLADVYYPLIAKKAKAGAYLDGPAGSSDPAATYVLSPAEPELVRVPKLAFDRPGGLVIPFFISRDDAATSLKRLQEVGKAAAADSEELQVTSLQKLVSLWEQGGFEGRSIEIFPRQADIDAATELLSDK